MITIQSDKVFEINAEAEYPEMSATVSLTTGHPRDRIQRVWAELKLSFNHEHFNYEINWEKELGAVREEQRFSLSPDQFAGGNLNFRVGTRVKYFANGRTENVYSNWYNNSIIAIQPSKQRIRDQHTSIELQVLTFYFSQFIQFTQEGIPSYNNGFGLSKLSNPTVEELWNWKSNILNLRNQFNLRYEEAIRYPSVLRETQPEIYTGLPDLNEEQVYIEVFQSYGNGKYFSPVKNPDSETWIWAKNQDNDSFADPIIQILKSVTQGNFPEGWND